MAAKMLGKVYSKSEYENRPGLVAVTVQLNPQDVIAIFLPENEAAQFKTGRTVAVTLEPLD